MSSRRLLLFLWVTSCVIVLVKTAATPNQNDDIDDRAKYDAGEFEIQHVVNRVFFTDTILPEKENNEASEEEDDSSSKEEGDDDDGEVAEEKVDIYPGEPYKHFEKWQQGWRRHPLYIIILGG
jgi:hypothetical protein